jgi:DNA-directed RNA polymerase specialized sigma24 family protein
VRAWLRRLAPRLAARRLRRRGRVVIVDGAARDAGSTRVTWGSPEVPGRERPGGDPYP